MPRNKYSSFKTKLPMISAYSSANSNNHNLNSHGKVNRLVESTNQISKEMVSLNEELQVNICLSRK